MDDELYLDNLPADPELAFFKLESQFRSRVDEKDADSLDYATYIDNVLSARDALGITFLSGWHRLPTSKIDYSAYKTLQRDIDSNKMFYRIKNTRRVDEFSVRFDLAAKQKLGHYLTQMREYVAKLEIKSEKKEAIFSKIEALQLEIDRDRTRFESLAALLVETSGSLGEAAEKLEPFRKWLDSIARVFWGAKEEEQKQLPAPRTPKLIEGTASQTVENE